MNKGREKIQEMIRGNTFIPCNQPILGILPLPCSLFSKDYSRLILGLNMIKGQIKALISLLHQPLLLPLPHRK